MPDPGCDESGNPDAFAFIRDLQYRSADLIIYSRLLRQVVAVSWYILTYLHCMKELTPLLTDPGQPYAVNRYYRLA